MIVRTPPMGWNSWNTFGTDITEDLIRQTADAMADTGLLAAGYEYLVIDDCWAERERGADGRLQASREKFPSGMKALSNYVHSRGLKFGIYSCAGVLTCAAYPASFEHEFVDAQTFADWGVDFLKYDYCHKPAYENGRLLYTRMGTALANCGRDILFSACSWGADDTKSWIKGTGAHMWRSTGDINDSWASVKDVFRQQLDIQAYNGQGCFNDMDMLIVGMKGQGNVGVTGCTTEEYRTHFSLWALFNSPLMIGCDVRHMDTDTKAILTNAPIIAVNQDPAGRQPFLLQQEGERMVWAKALDGGDYAIGIFNLSDGVTGSWNNLGVHLTSLGLNRSCNRALALRDLWTGEELGTYEDAFYPGTVPAHGCRMLRARVVACP